MLTIYGIKNCDTMKKALKWLTENGIEHTFHDYRKAGLTRQMLLGWEAQLGWALLVNKRGTTWRKFDDEVKQKMNSENSIDVMLENEAVIKRPLLDLGDGRLELGFKAERYAELFL
ncbi:MAG: ArsC family reductase [Gammaproteobacteria bacterium]|nr:ArsC family reductase [Gammaproteobacteria bacterium]